MAVNFQVVPSTYPGDRALQAAAQGIGIPNIRSNFGQFLQDPGSMRGLTFGGALDSAGGVSGAYGYIGDMMKQFSDTMAPFLKAAGVNTLLSQGVATGGAGQGIPSAYDQSLIASLMPAYMHEYDQALNLGSQALSNLVSRAQSSLQGLLSQTGAAALTPERVVTDPVSIANTFGSTEPGSFANPVGGFGQNGGVGPLGGTQSQAQSGAGSVAGSPAAGQTTSGNATPTVTDPVTGQQITMAQFNEKYSQVGRGTGGTRPPTSGIGGTVTGEFLGYGPADPFTATPGYTPGSYTGDVIGASAGYNPSSSYFGGSSYTPGSTTAGLVGAQSSYFTPSGSSATSSVTQGAKDAYTDRSTTDKAKDAYSFPIPVNPNVNPYSSVLGNTNYGAASWGSGLGYSTPSGYGV